MKFTGNHDLGLALMRIVVGGVFLAHGAQKLFQFGIAGVAGGMAQMGIPFPTVSAVLVTAAEFGGGLFLLLGLLTRLAAIPVAFTMLVAFLKVHMRNGLFLPNGFEYVLVLFAANLAFMISGPGAWALDNVVFGNREQRSRN